MSDEQSQGYRESPKQGLRVMSRNKNSKDEHSFMVENIMFLNHENQTRVIFEIISPRRVRQGPAQCDPQAKSGPPPGFVNTALLAHGRPICLHRIYGCCHHAPQFSSCDSYHTGHKAKNTYSLTLYRLHRPCPRLKISFWDLHTLGSVLSSFDYR